MNWWPDEGRGIIQDTGLFLVVDIPFSMTMVMDTIVYYKTVSIDKLSMVIVCNEQKKQILDQNAVVLYLNKW